MRRPSLALLIFSGTLLSANPVDAMELAIEPSYRVYQSETLGDDKTLDIDLRLTVPLVAPSPFRVDFRVGYRSFSYFGKVEGIPWTVGARFDFLDGPVRPSLYLGAGAFFGFLTQFDNSGTLAGLLVSGGGAVDVVISYWIGGVFVGWERYFGGFDSLGSADWVMVGLRLGRGF